MNIWIANSSVTYIIVIWDYPLKHGPKKKTYLCSLLFKLLDGPLVNASTLVDEVTSSGGLARVHMANDHNVDVDFLLPHAEMWGTVLVLGNQIGA